MKKKFYESFDAGDLIYEINKVEPDDYSDWTLNELEEFAINIDLLDKDGNLICTK